MIPRLYLPLFTRQTPKNHFSGYLVFSLDAYVIFVGSLLLEPPNVLTFWIEYICIAK
jgi:hypothetical protein